MPYTSSPYAAKARFEAAKLVVKDGMRASQVARMYGVHRSTVGKWAKRFPRKLNQYGHFISTISSAPNHHLHQTPEEVVERIIHVVRNDFSRYYIYCLIDVYSRLAYAEYHIRLRQGISYLAVKNAQKYLKSNFKMIQTDHGPEFGNGFTYLLSRSSIKLRHSRIRKPNDKRSY